MELRFGTDGWRGVIADDFTFANARRVVQGIMSYMTAGARAPKVLVGCDTRFLSEDYARVAAEVACANGATVLISPHPVSTPVLSYAVVAEGASGGIMITASHNPCTFNGVKFKPAYGGSATPEITARIESLIPPSSPPLFEPKGRPAEHDFVVPYISHIKKLFDIDAIINSRVRVMIDCMHGAAGCFLGRAVSSLGLDAKLIRAARDPYFGGSNPEPLAENMTRLSAEVGECSYALGVALDGDADRLGVVDGHGVFLWPYEVMALILLHLSKNRGLRGIVVKTVSTSSLIDRMARDLRLPVRETPVGFKNICGIMLKEDVLLAGEENGGFAFKGHIPERDGFLAGLMLLELLAKEGRTLEDLLADVYNKYGRLYYKRVDAPVDPARAARIRGGMKERAEAAFKEFGIKETRDEDGVKVIGRDGSWILFRLSGTEPLLRIYAEADDSVKMEKLIARGREALLD